MPKVCYKEGMYGDIQQIQITIPADRIDGVHIFKDQLASVEPSFGFGHSTQGGVKEYDKPPLPCSSCSLPGEIARLRSERAYWQAMHQKALEREARLKEENAEIKAKLRLRERQLFGRKSEKDSHPDSPQQSTEKEEKKPRGQQHGSNGHGRRSYSHLPVREEIRDLPESEQRCPICGLEYAPFPDTEDSQVIEIEVSAYRRVIRRKRYKPTCKCGDCPGIVTAPAPPKLIPKGIFGISVWVTVLLDKFLSLRPTYRLLADLSTHGLDMSQGTLTDGLKTIAPVFTPVYKAIIARNLQEKRWHADETRWFVFATVEGKVGYRWYMWVFSSPSTVVYTLDKSRSAKVPKAHFGSHVEGILVVDRYCAYKAMVKGSRIILAFCWSHVRRDFLAVVKDRPEHETWAMSWVEEIGHLYHLNKLRLAVTDQPQAFAQRDHTLRCAIEHMAQRWDNELKGNNELKENRIASVRLKVLESLKNHWQGLIVFVDHPEVPMDNNEAERLERKPVLGRKNFYGSGSLWSGQMAAVLLSIFQTLGLWTINPRLWFTAYLQACAENRGNAPLDISSFLPWNMSDEQRKAFSLAPQTKDSLQTEDSS